MSTADRAFIKYNIPTWINLSTLIAIVAFIIYQSKWQQTVDSHIQDKSIHVETSNNMLIFVPRIELDKRLYNIEKSQEKILDILLKK